ncbi:hypothetical protein ACIQ7Q_07375 [Streptomyces sp. NPDC096176]|uniref:hypothetical protein n=1 Tax=Streptomyces sp. NPDC096176 TaxID=3366079 RepID=UPI0038105BB4
MSGRGRDNSYEHYEHYGPDGPSDDRTGNEIVNNGPNNGPRRLPTDTGPAAGPDAERDAASDTGSDMGADVGSGHGFEIGSSQGPDAGEDNGSGRGTDRGPDLAIALGLGTGIDRGMGVGGDGDEDALRRLLQGAVEDIQPSPGALEHLHRAVPARRARKRQALVGMAAAALLIGTAVPAFVHVANSAGSEKPNPINAGHGEQAQGGTGNEPGVTGGDNGTKGPTQGAGGTVVPGRTTGPNRPTDQPTGVGDGASGSVQSPAAGEVPACTSDQLSVSTELGVPDAEGKVYGTFRVTNISGTDCFAAGSTIGFQAMGAADAARIGVARHAAGDAASGLPDPTAAETDAAIAVAAKAYEMKFAWVPSDTCPTEDDPSPDPSPSVGDSSGGGQGGTGTSEGSAAEPQLVTEDGLKDGSVAVTYSGLGGSVTGQTTVPNACAGTIYYTGVLPGQ